MMMLPMIAFMEPGRLWWLLMIPALLVLYLVLLRRKSNRSRSTGISNLDKVLPKQQAWKRHIAVGAAVLALAALNVAFAKPADQVDVPRDRATIVLALDVSRSMIAEDVQPNRLDAAKAAAKDFLGMLPPRFNVALVAFAGSASVVVAPTTDRGLVSRAVDGLQVAPSTSIGEGIYSSLDAMALAPVDPDHPDDPAPGAIVLLSDGFTNIPRYSAPAAEEAKKRKIPIYTIAYGTPDGYVVDGGRREPVPVNHEELQRVADISGGKKFSAGSASELKDVYKNIAAQIGYVKEEQEVTEIYTGYALGFAVLAAIAVISLGARWP
ncbi:MAG: VWA domain-containing protein [Micropruina sp.]|uniref:VWA domain-containing protein n=1 Tax=Micropruina sp. TaxID=2737536 RepID=UPI0039E51419